MELPQPDPHRQHRAKEYARIRRRLLLVGLAIALGGVLFLLFVASRPLDALIRQLTTNPWLEVAVYILAVSVAYLVVISPLTYYAGFVSPHRYGLSVQMLRSWLWDQAKGAALNAALGFPLIEGLYWLLCKAPDTWWIWAAVGMLVVTVGLSMLAPILLLPLFYKPLPLDSPDLVHRLIRLAERAGARVEGVYTIDLSAKTTAANAGLMGLGHTRRIVVGDTLLDRYAPEEIEAILAHELGHHVHRYIGWGIAVNTVLTLGGCG